MLSRRSSYLLILLAVAVFAAVKQDIPILQFVLLVYGLIALAILLPIPKVLNFLSAKILLAILLSAVLFQVEAILFWLLRLHITGVVYVLSLFLATNVALVYALTHKLEPIVDSVRKLKPSLADIAVLGPTVLICGAILFGDFRSGSSYQASIVSTLSYGVDDVAHVNMFSDEYRAHSNLILGSHVAYPVVNPANNTYPKGSYLDASIYAGALSGEKSQAPTVLKLFDAYFVAKNVMLFLAISTFSLLLWTVAVLFDKDKKNKVRNVVFVVVFSLLISSILIVTLWWQGFYSYVPALIFGFLFAAFLLAREEHEPIEKHLFLYLSLCVIGSAFTWLLAAPALFVSLLLYLPKPSSWKLTPKVCVTYMRQNIFYLFGAFVGLFVICLQLYAQIRWSSGIDAVNQPGGISLPPQLLAVTIFLSLSALLLRRSDSSAALRKSMVNWLIPLLGLALVILLFECLKGHGASYYFYKMEYLLLAFSSLASFGFLLELFNTRSTASKNQPAEPLLYQLAVFVIVIGTIFLVTTDFGWMKAFLDQLRGVRPFSPQTAQIITGSLDKQLSTNNPEVFFVLPRDIPVSIVGSNMANASHPSVTCVSQLYQDLYVPGALMVPAFANQLASCLESPGGPQYVVYTSKSAKQIFDAVLKNAAMPNRVTIKIAPQQIAPAPK